MYGQRERISATIQIHELSDMLSTELKIMSNESLDDSISMYQTTS